jgi:hypothetical protein
MHPAIGTVCIVCICMLTALIAVVCCHCCFLQVFDSPGYLDLFIPCPHRMALELTRQGKQLRTHIERFVHGHYEVLLSSGAAVEWAVVDFRSKTAGQPTLMHENLYSVVVSDDCKQAEIWCNGHLVGGQPVLIAGRADDNMLAAHALLQPHLSSSEG